MSDIYKYIWLLLIFPVVGGGSAYAENKKEYKLVFLHRTSQTLGILNNETDEDINDDPGIYSGVLVGLFGHDSIYIYNDFYREPSPALYTLEKKGNDLAIIALENPRLPRDTMLYRFDADECAVRVYTKGWGESRKEYLSRASEKVLEEDSLCLMNCNTYYLNDDYFTALYREAVVEHRLFPLTRLFTEGVEDFAFLQQSLVDYVWFPKALQKDHKMKKAQVYTHSPHSDLLYRWNVSYLYEDGELIELKKEPDDDIAEGYMYMDLLHTEDTLRSYKISWSGRYYEEIYWYMDPRHLTDSMYLERQRHGYTHKYNASVLQRKEYTIDKLDLTREEIRDLIEEDLKATLSR